eukprot:COSAG02_NODE_9757_length_2119_cov_2.147030_2_plen_256_part_00
MHELAQHALQPRNHASPSPTAAQDSRFQSPAGCRWAHTGQHRHLATSSLRQRAPAGRTPLANRPRAGPSTHSIAHPHPLLHHVSPRTRVPTASAVPSGARCSHSSAAQRTLSAQEASPRIHHPAQIATTDSVYLQHSNTEVNNHTYCNGAMARGPEDSTTPGRVALVAAHCRNGKPFRAPAKPRAGRPDTTREPAKSWAFRPLNRPPPSLQHVSPRPRVPTASAVPSGARCTTSCAKKFPIMARRALDAPSKQRL